MHKRGRSDISAPGAFARGRLLWLVLIAGSLLQQPGKVTWDTKLDLTEDPTGFLRGSLHLWNPQASFGELQNQAYGYLFPQGPFFLLGQALQLPDWVTQRLWSALLLVVAFEGTRYVARAIGMPALSGVLAGLAYALAPRLLGAVGVLSGEILPSALLPWALLPLVLARAGRLSAPQAGLWSGTAVLCMSGVNAVGTLATFPLLVAVILGSPGSRARLLGWWTFGVGLACAWWLVPLVILGRYSPPFLDFIETSSATTSSTGWANDVRGAEHWLAYFTIGEQAWWPGANLMVSQPLLIVLGGIISAAGFAGLCHPRMPLRGPLLAAAGIGLLCLTAATPGVLGSLVDAPVRELLDGPLAPLRNVHKVDPLVRLPLALGLAHAVRLTLAALPTYRRQHDAAPRVVSPWVPVGLVVALLASGAPLLTGQLRMPGFERVPEAWAQTAAYLDDQPRSRAVVVPGSGFGLQTWGWTIDEPLQGVADSSWVARSQVPLVPGPTARYLDVIERRVASGEGGAGLADLLARGGITHVVLRRDLDLFSTETVPTDRAELALAASGGLERVASFGRSGFGEQGLVDVYRVDRPVSMVSLTDAAALPTMRGAPEDVLTAIESGVLEPDLPVVVSGATGVAPDLATDGYTRVERQFGRVHDALSQVLGRAEDFREDRPSADFPGVEGVPLTTAEYVAGLEATASSSSGYADEIGAVQPEYGPAAALDGSDDTQWRSGSFTPPDEQWFEVRLDEPRESDGVLSAQFEQGPGQARVERVRVTLTSAGRQTSEVVGVPDHGLLLWPVPTDLSVVRLEVVAATDPRTTGGTVAISELVLPGVEPGRSRVLPGLVGPATDLAWRLTPPRRACVDLGIGPRCEATQARAGENAGRLSRTFEVSEAGEWVLTGGVVATPGAAAARLLRPLGRDGRIFVNTVLAGDPAVAGQYAFDANSATPWVGGQDADTARFRIRWRGVRVLTQLTVSGIPQTAVAPASATLRSGDETRSVEIGDFNTFAPLAARGGVTIKLFRPEGVQRPMGAGELNVKGLSGLQASPSLDTPTGAGCGLGPPVVVDGVTHDTTVRGTMRDVRDARPLAWEVCDGPVSLPAGEHRVTAEATLQFQPVTLGWDAISETTLVPSAAERSMEVSSWGPESRAVLVGPGAESVLRVAENINPGWRAELDGAPLEQVTLDGWQQGYVVPEGEGGTVDLVYAADRPYRVGLLLGLVLAGLLVLLAVGGWVTGRRRSGREEPTEVDLTPRPAGRRTRAGIATGLLVLGGPVAGAAYLAVHVSRVRRLAGPLGAALVALSAVAVAVSPGGSVGRVYLAEAAAAAGVALLLGVATWPPATERGRPRLTRDRVVGAMRTGVRRHGFVLAGVGLVAGQAVVRGQVAAGSYFWQDDFLHLSQARSLGLSLDYLVRDYSGHLETGQYAFIWAMSHLIGTSFLPAAVSLVLLQLVASVLLLVVLRLVFGTSPWLLVPFAAYLFTPLALVTSTWWAAGLQAYPLQISFLTALIGLVRFRSTGRVRWAVVSVAGHVLGLVCWEKAALVLPALVAVALLVLAQGPARDRWRQLWGQRWLWAAHVVALGGYVAAYLSVVGAGGFSGERDRGVLATVAEIVFGVLLPGLAGGPWSVEGAQNTVFPNPGLVAQAGFASFAVLLVVVSLWRRGPAAIAGWVLVAAYLVADLTLVVIGRAEYLGLVARDPRYVTDALPVIVIGVCASFSGPRRQRRGATSWSRPRIVSWSAATCTAAVVVSCLITTVGLTPGLQHDSSRTYARTLTDQLADDPGVSVFDTPLPTEVSVSVPVEGLLLALGREQVLDRPGTSTFLIGPGGELRPATLIGEDLVVPGPVPDCGWPLSETPTTLVELPEDRARDRRALRLEFVSGGDAVLHVRVDGVEQAVRVSAGVGEAFLALPSRSGEVEAWLSDNVRGMCVAELRRGIPWPDD